MSDVKKCPNVVLNTNLAVTSACLELGAAAILQVMGKDEASTHIAGEALNISDLQELLAARIAKTFDQ